jgi:alpha-D-ribose 1-methylphosphonate 5-triphosphate synthase subunit PhnG
MAAFALASLEDLEAAWAALPNPPDYRRLRGPDAGLVMVRGRAGGTGGAFNLGEMTVTRCTVQIGDDLLGHAYIAGTDPRHAELAAVFDALMQDPVRAAELEQTLVAPLVHRRDARRREDSAKIARSRVEFFAMVRGEDER